MSGESKDVISSINEVNNDTRYNYTKDLFVKEPIDFININCLLSKLT